MNYFFVFQNKTYQKEKKGGYLWAPKTNNAGNTVSHWTNMKNVKKDDIIIHSYNKEIVAISITQCNCFSEIQPDELMSENLWDNDGWKVNCDYIIMDYPIVTSDYMDILLKLQPKKYAPFNRLGKGNTGYLFDSNKEMAEFIIDKLKIRNDFKISTFIQPLLS